MSFRLSPKFAIGLSVCLSALFVSINGYATNYYISSLSGDDGNAGITKDAPWKSMANLEKKQFAPGDSILFARGSSYTGGFDFKNSGTAGKPIVFSYYSVGKETVLSTPREKLTPIFEKYGAGPAPSFTNPDFNVLDGNIFKIEANYVVVDGFYFHDNTNPPMSDKKVKNVQKMGAVYFALGYHHNIVKNCEFFHTPVGIKIKSTYSAALHNNLHDCSNMMAYSWGPIAIMVTASNNEVAYNHIENYGAYGGPYGSDGGVVELDGVDDNFKANNVNIHHNTAINNHGFLEIAARGVDSITVAYNLSDDRNQFIGGGGYKVNVYNNTVIRTREPNVDRYIFWTFNPELTFYNVRNNIFVIAPDLKVFGPVKPVKGHVRVVIGEQPHSNNLYYSVGNTDPIGIKPGMGDVIADPLFLDFENRNFRLSEKSPAKNKGAKLGYAIDLDGYTISGQKPSIGAYQY